MPRAHRYFLPGHVWHITHRCHKKEFLLKFVRDRERWRVWLFEARKRYGLCVLNYIVTSNHIHLLLLDQGKGEIAKSMQLIAGRTAQEYNQRKHRKGAYWEDRYHATAVDTDAYLARCMVYIDLNMVRAGVVKHPKDWRWSGYYELYNPKQRYAVLNNEALLKIFAVDSIERLKHEHQQWVHTELQSEQSQRDAMWSDSLAAGSQPFVEKVQAALSVNAQNRKVQLEEGTGVYTLKENDAAYTAHFDSKMSCLSVKNTYFLE